ncbi:putative late blight resistance protein homolog R1B-12 [Nicotiana tabacum]|uniref:Late blight resistance protein homolog R1B-12 n=1 Tax=Nicotiana tabacum TaxID=4097 RepID=A0A1S3YVY3_TOBAC
MGREQCYQAMTTIKKCMATRHLNSSTKDQLRYAYSKLGRLYYFLASNNPENWISAQLGPLFDEAYDGFSEVLCLLRDQDLASDTDTIRIISEKLQIVYPESTADRICPSKQSRSVISRQVTMEMVNYVAGGLSAVHKLIPCITRYLPVALLLDKLKYLRTLLSLTAERCIEHEKMKDLFIFAEDVLYTAAYQSILCWKMDEESQPRVVGSSVNLEPDFTPNFSELLERMNLIEPEWRQLCISVLKPSYSSVSKVKDLSFSTRVTLFVNFLKKDLEELLSLDEVAFPDGLQWLQHGLDNLSEFPGKLNEAYKQDDPLLISYPQALAIEAAITIYSLYDVNLTNNTEIDNALLPLQAKFSHLDVEIILLQKLSSENSMKYYFLEELIFMRTFLMDTLDQCKEQIQISNVLPLVLSVNSDAGSLINSPSRDSKEGESARGINLLHFQLLLKFKFIKAAIRQIISAPERPMINLLNFLPTKFEAIDSYFTMLISSKTYDSPKMDEVFMRFHEYILENLLLEDEANLKLTDTDKFKRFHHGLLLLVTFLVDPPIQYIDCKKQNCLLTELGTIAIEAEAAISLSDEDALDRSKNGKVSLLLQLVTVAFKLFKWEGKLTDILKHKTTLESQFLDLVENAHEELIFLRAFLMDLLRHHRELNQFEDFLMNAEVAADKAALISSYSYESSYGEMSLSISDFLKEIKSVNSETRELCFRLLDESVSCITISDLKCLMNMLFDMLNHLNSLCEMNSFVRNRIPVVQEKLKCLDDIFQKRNMYREVKDLMECVLNVAYEEKYVIFFSVSGDSRAWFHMLYLSDVRKVLNFVEAEVKTVCSKFPTMIRLCFPNTSGLGFLNCFLGKLEELLQSKLELVTHLKPQIVSVKEELLCLSLFFNHLAENYDEQDEVHDHITNATETAYKAEYVIDSCLAGSYPLWYKVHWITEVVENIKLVNKDVSENCKRKKIDMNQAAKGSTNPVPPSISAITAGANEEMVGFQDVMDKLKLQLLGGSDQLDVISIYGMPGNGKTTLAKKIYNDPAVGSHFDVRAMCYVTQVYSRRELLLDILKDVHGPAECTKKEDGELANELRRYLLTKRFLILIDDVWDTAAWDDLHLCFQGSQNRSRVILTTRLYEVADYAKCKSDPHHLRLFTDDESWMLLKEEVFRGEICPPELGEVGLRIAKSCGGLPLSVVLVAGVLKEKKKKAYSWKKVEESLGSHSFGSSEKGMSIIGFSYKNLPHRLKTCFLYFGGFLRGKHIPVSKLSRVWLAEGFLEEDSKEKGSEEAAQDYLQDLTRRNLVTDMKKKSNGKLKTCRVHDLLHQFCVEKAKQDNFLLWIHRDQCADSTFYPEIPKEYRLSVYSKRDELAQLLTSGSSTRSLLFNANNNVDSSIFSYFKLVKVLDMESIYIGNTFPSEIISLIHLRYFAARTGADSIPSSVANLWNLETFIVKGLRGELKLPHSLLKMFKLRHIHVNSRASFSLDDDMFESLDNSGLVNLETFSTPCLSYGEDAEKILRSMPNLRKLRCIFQGSSTKMTGNCVLFPRLDFLHQLESLKLLSNSYPAKQPHEFNFPSKLRELTLSNFRLPWNQISAVSELPNLEILKLLFRAFDGNLWEVKDSDFPELKYLKLDSLNIVQWSVSDEAFPQLERLVLTKCKRLEKIPPHFEDAVSLKIIEVSWCNRSVDNSAQEIQETQHDMQNHAFTVTIQLSDWATRYPRFLPDIPTSSSGGQRSGP